MNVTRVAQFTAAWWRTRGRAEHPAYLSKKLETQHFATNSSPFCIYTPTNRLWSIAGGACTTYGQSLRKRKKDFSCRLNSPISSTWSSWTLPFWYPFVVPLVALLVIIGEVCEFELFDLLFSSMMAVAGWLIISTSFSQTPFLTDSTPLAPFSSVFVAFISSTRSFWWLFLRAIKENDIISDRNLKFTYFHV